MDRTLTTSTSTNLKSTIWTFAGGYTVAEGNWGNVDLIAGVRLLAIDDATNFGLAVDITRPDGSIALGHSGNLSASKSVWNGIGGVRGRVYLGDSDWFGGGEFFVPYYFDIGGGGSDPDMADLRRRRLRGRTGRAYRSAIDIFRSTRAATWPFRKCRWAVPSSSRTSNSRLRSSLNHSADADASVLRTPKDDTKC